MKWLIASDIHGSAAYTKELLERFQKERADRLILLGDLLYHGPRNALPGEYDPKAVAAMLNEYRNEILSVRGNCDAEVDQMLLDFPILADYALWELGDRMVFLTHGHLYNENNLPPLKKGDILLHGHTHVPGCTVHSDYIYMNPGSVSIPKGGSERGYLTYENGVFLFKNLAGEERNRLSL